MIDSHCHLEFGHFDEDREEVIERAKEEISAIVDSSADTETFSEVLELGRKNPSFIFPTLGLSPSRAVEKTEEEIDRYFQDIRDVSDEIVGVGEVGLDYYHIDSSSGREKSKQIFADFISLSDDLDLPLVVHSRDSMSDALEILRWKEGEVVIHCFSGEVDQLEEALERGYYISYGGAIFRSRRKYEELVYNTPLERLVLETDAPFLAKRKGDRSEPWFIREIAEEISDIKGADFSEVWRTAGDNSAEVFDLEF